MRLAKERQVLVKERRVRQEVRSICFERNSSECTSKASECGVCVHSLIKVTLTKGLSADGKLILVFYCDCQRHR